VSFGLGSAVRVVTWVIVGSRWHVGDNLAARGPSASRSRRVEHIVHTVTLRVGMGNLSQSRIDVTSRPVTQKRDKH